MYRRLVLSIIFLLFIWIRLDAQDTVNYVAIDKDSYNYMINSDWNNLKKTCKLGLQHNIDYYYLRMRFGIALYYKKNYAGAARHFNKAHSFNSSDTLLQEYLYYSYLLSGQYDKLNFYQSEMSPRVKEKLGVNDSDFLKYVCIESDFSTNMDYEKLKVSDIYSDMVVNDQLFPKYQSNNFISLTHQLGKHSTLTHAYTYLYVDKLQRIVDIEKMNILEQTQKTIQNQYYIKAHFPSANGFSVNVAVHFIRVKSYFVKTILQSQFGTDKKIPVYINTLYDNVEKLVNVSFHKRYSKLDLGTSFSVGKLSNIAERQLSMDFMYYPFGNRHFYFGSQLISLYQRRTNQWLVKPTLGLSYKKFELQCSTINGTIENYHENDGLVVYNSMDRIKNKHSCFLNFYMNKHISLFAGYQYIVFESWIDRYDPMSIIRDYYNYNTNMFILSFKYRI